MFEQALDGRTLAVLLTLGGAGDLAEFYLAGGSAVALHYGHRVSDDLDLFVEEPFAEESLTSRLKRLGRFELDRTGEGTVTGRLEGVRIACYHIPILCSMEPRASRERSSRAPSTSGP